MYNEDGPFRSFGYTPLIGVATIKEYGHYRTSYEALKDSCTYGQIEFLVIISNHFKYYPVIRVYGPYIFDYRLLSWRYLFSVSRLFCCNVKLTSK